MARIVRLHRWLFMQWPEERVWYRRVLAVRIALIVTEFAVLIWILWR